MSDKEKIQKRIVELDKTINEMVSRGRMFSDEEVSDFEHLTFELESLKFQLRTVEDGSK